MFSSKVESGVKSKFEKEKGKLGKPQRSDFALRGVDPMVEEKIEAAFKYPGEKKRGSVRKYTQLVPPR